MADLFKELLKNNDEENKITPEVKEVEDFSDLFDIEEKEVEQQDIEKEQVIFDSDFEKFLYDENNNPNNDELKKMLINYPSLPSFETLMLWKFENKDIFLIDVGSPLESILYGASIDKYIITTFKAEDYYNFIEKVGSIAKNKKEYFKTIINTCLLYPRETDLEKMQAGVAELIIGTILKNSKLESNFDIKRL